MLKRIFCGALGAALAAVALAPAAAPASVVAGQSGWAWGNPLPQGNNLRDIEFAGPRGYASGDFGTVVRTDDAGATWTGVTTGVTADLVKLRILGTDSFVVGGGCVARRTDDGGAHFARMPFTASDFSCPSDLAAISFGSPTVGYIALADKTLLRTADGGKTFSRKTAVPDTPTDMAFLGPDTGVATTSGGKIYRTGDGGGSWTLVASNPGALAGLTFTSGTTGYAVGSAGSLLTTGDGGATWTRREITVGGGTPNLTSIRCADPTTCLMTTDKGDQVIRTVDGGATVSSVTPSSDPISAAAFSSPARAVAVGALGTTVASNDAGMSFAPIGGRIPASLFRLRGGAGGVAFALGDAGTYAKTTDGGKTWVEGAISTGAALVDLAFPTPAIGYALDDAGNVQRTDNGGSSWAVLSTGSSAHARAVVATSASTVLLVGPRGVRRSTNSGGDFSRVSNKAIKSQRLSDADSAGGSVFAWGSKVLLASTDKGKTWKKLKRPSKSAIRRVDFVSAKTGFAVVSGGHIYKTSSRGKRWTELVAAGGNDVSDLSFSSATRGYMVIDSFADDHAGYTLRTSDGGKTWRPQLVSQALLLGVVALPSGADYALSANNGLFFTTTGGDTGNPSRLTLKPSHRRLRKPGSVKISGTLSGAIGGEQVVIYVRAKGAGSYRQIIATVASNGKFSITRRVSKTSFLVAQWRGDDDRAGDGTPVVTVRVGGK